MKQIFAKSGVVFLGLLLFYIFLVCASPVLDDWGIWHPWNPTFTSKAELKAENEKLREQKEKIFYENIRIRDSCFKAVSMLQIDTMLLRMDSISLENRVSDMREESFYWFSQYLKTKVKYEELKKKDSLVTKN